jgi:uracil-DNA glycosylase
MPSLKVVAQHLDQVRACSSCPSMIGPVVTPQPIVSNVYLCGQAPGPREGALGRPFAWTAGKTLFRWFDSLGVPEDEFRRRVFIGAVCRCFPGKTKQGGDRVPDAREVEACSRWMRREIELFRPALVIPVGKLAIERFLPAAPLAEIVGKQHRVDAFGHGCDAIPLPHPSGASTWFRVEPGVTLLARALRLVAKHPAWRAVADGVAGTGARRARATTASR